MAKPSLCVPWRPDSGPRERAWAWCSERLRLLHSDCELVVADAEGPWSRARALNAAVDASEGELLVLLDADCALDPRQLHGALRACPREGWASPFDSLLRLSGDATEELLAQHPGLPELSAEGAREFYGTGGACVIHRDLWRMIGRIDPRFEGWGGEDNWLRHQLQQIAGPPVQVPGPLVHLWHPRPQSRKQGPSYERNRELMEEALRG